MKNLHTGEVDVSTNHIGVDKPFGILSFGVKVWDV
jgi:hypothetical protein